jgi:BlaI family penicillinase repressor
MYNKKDKCLIKMEGNRLKGLKRLSDMEYVVMGVIWKNKPPVNTGIIMEAVGEEKKWKMPTLISYLNRLTEKGFIRSEKKGRDRWYYPIIDEKEYLEFETNLFFKTYHHNSLFSLMSTLYDGKKITKEEAEEFRKWIGEDEDA